MNTPAVSGEYRRRSARDYNETLAAIRRARHSARLGASTARPRGRPGEVWVYNENVTELAPFSVAAITGVVYDVAANEVECQQRPTLTVDFVGSTTEGADGFVVAQEQIPGQGLGRAAIYGAVFAYVDVSDADHQYAETGVGEAYLQSCASGGARVLWKETGTGAGKAAIVMLPGTSASGATQLDVTRGAGTVIADAVETSELSQAFLMMNVSGTPRVCLNLAALHVCDVATNYVGPMNSLLRVTNGTLALSNAAQVSNGTVAGPIADVFRITSGHIQVKHDVQFSDGTNAANFSMLYNSNTAQWHADGAYPKEAT
jgi:hypothetical protein